MAEDIIFKIELDSTDAEKQINDTTKAIDGLKLSTKELQKQQKELEKQGKANTKEYQENSKQIYENQQATKKLNQTRREAQKVIDTQINSLDAERLQLSKLTAERNKLDKSTVEGAKKFEQLNIQIKELSDSIKESEQAGGDFRRSVGDYKTAFDGFNQSIEQQTQKLAELKKAQSQLNLETKEGQKIYSELQTQIEGTEKNLDKLGKTGQSSFDKLSEGAESFGISSEVLSTILKASPLLILPAILIGLFKAFSKTTEGAKILKVASAALSVTFETITGLVGEFAVTVVKAFQNPVESIKSLGDAILTNVINRFKGLVDILSITGQALIKLAKGDFQGVIDSADELATAFVQISTGLDEKQQQAFANSIQNVTNKINDQVKSAANLELAYQNLAKQQRTLEVEIAKLNAEADKQSEIAADTTQSFKEQEKALLLSLKAREEAAKLQTRLSQESLKLANEELRIAQVAGTAQDDLLDKQKEARLQLIEAEAQYTITLQQNAKERNQLEQDRIEQDLDVQIDGFDKIKTINEQRIADERTVLEERVKIFEETKKLNETALEAQKKSIEKLAGEEIDLQDLVNENDAVVLNEKLKRLELSEIATARLFEVVREQQQTIQDFATIEKDLDEQKINRLKDRTNAVLETQKLEIEARLSVAKTDEEKFKIEQELIAKDTEIRRKAIEEEITDEVLKNEAIKQLEIEQNTALEELQTEEIEKRKEKQIDYLNFLREGLSTSLSLYSDYVNALNTADDNRIRKIDKNYKQERDLLQSNLEKGLISQEQFDAKTNELDKKKDNEVEAIEKKAFERNKKLRIAQATIAMFESAINAFNSLAVIPIVGPVLGVAAASAALATGALNISNIKKQEFAEGGIVYGKSHAEGGIPFTVQGQGGYEMEGGEFIVRKSSVNADTLPILNAINGGNGSNNGLFAAGGVVRTQNEQNNVNAINRAQETNDFLSNTKIVVMVEDILSQSQKVVNVENFGNL